MAIISNVDLKSVDLNLLVVFDALMQERNVTRTAARIHITQGAVSAALGRLRQLFDDALFVRGREGMAPTPKALSIAPKVGQALAMINGLVFQPKEFDPVSADRTFHLAMSDDLEAVFLPTMLDRAARHSWNVQFAFHQTNSALWQATLDDPKIDLILCASPTNIPAAYQQSVLFASSYSCLYDRAGSGLSTPITLDEYIEATHLRVAFNAQRGFVDALFETQGLHRKATASVSHFAGVIPALKASGAVATIPTYAAKAYATSSGLVACDPPIPVPRFTISLIWEVHRGSDPEHLWLRQLIDQCAGTAPINTGELVAPPTAD